MSSSEREWIPLLSEIPDSQVGARFLRWITRSRRRIRNRVSNAHVGTFPTDFILFLIDFTKDDLREALLKSGFDPRKKTFFSWLGVSMYLCRDDIEKMLDCIASLSADGSDLVFDYADAGLFLSDVKRVWNMLAMAKAGGEEMKSGFDQMSLELMLADHGFLVYEHLGSHDIQNAETSPKNGRLERI